MTAAREPRDDFEHAPCGLATLAANGSIRRTNAMLRSWFGAAEGELEQRRFQDLLTVGGRIFHQTHWLPLLHMQGSVAEVQMELVAADARVLPVLVNAVLRQEGVVDLALFVVVDWRKYERELLVARRRAEELLELVRIREVEFRMVAENSPDVIVRFDRDHRCQYLSPAAAAFVDRPIEELLGHRPADIPFLAPLATGLADALRGEEITCEWAASRGDGTQRELEARIVPERDTQGDVSSALAIARDVTLMRTQEQEARRQAVLAEQLVGIVSHDLRNPLNAVLLGTALLATPDLASRERTVQRIASAAQRANRLVADLLDFTRARLGGGLSANRRGVDAHALVAEALDEVRLARAERAIVHARSGEGEVSIDPDRLVQVVTNLVSNALVYGDLSRPVTVTSAVSASAFEVSVHNEGEPIPAELLARIFEPMQRGIEAGADRRSVGLGLYIVREIAAAHGGTITVRSLPEEGTTFTWCVPRSP